MRYFFLPLVSSLSLFAALLVSHTANAELCTPPFASDAPRPASQTMDDMLSSIWCLGGDWEPGYLRASTDLALDAAGTWGSQMSLDGFPYTCNPEGASVRLINAAEAAWQVTQSLAVTTDPVINPPGAVRADWAAFLRDRTTGYVNQGCTGGNTLASNPPTDDPVKLFYKFFWKLDAYTRAATLIHEATHQDVGHVKPGTCAYAPSCDDAFGNGNAQTLDIYFMLESALAYQRQDLASTTTPKAKLLETASFGSGVCGYLPLLSPAVRAANLALAQDKISRAFESPSPALSALYSVAPSSNLLTNYGGFDFAIDATAASRWACDAPCKTADYKPGGASYCDVDTRAANEAVNKANLKLCQDSIGTINAGVTQDELATATQVFHSGKKACLKGYDQSYLDAYCDLKSLSSITAQALDTSWDLPDVPGLFNSEQALKACAQKYCTDKEFGAVRECLREPLACYGDASCEDTLDASGCITYACGDLNEIASASGESSIEYFHAVQCRRSFLEDDTPIGIAPQVFDASDCEQQYAMCRDLEAFDDWKARGAACPLVPGVGPASGAYSGQHDFGALQAIGFSDSYTTWKSAALSHIDSAYQDQYAANFFDGCVAAYEACQSSEELLAKISAKLGALAEEPGPFTGGPGFGRPHWDPVADGVMQLLGTLRANDATESDKAKARRTLFENGEAFAGLTRILGESGVLAMHGSKGRSAFVGQAALDRFATSDPVFSRLTLDAPTKTEAARVGGVRQLLASPDVTQQLGAALDDKTPAEQFDLVQGFGTAPNSSTLESKLNEALGL